MNLYSNLPNQNGQRNPTIREHMLRMLSLGFSLTPPFVKEGKNKGQTVMKWGAYQTQRPTIEEVEKWCRLYPRHNYGIITGELSGVVCVDTDDDEAELQVLERCQATPVMQRSGSGRGVHRLYRYPGFFVKTDKKLKIDGQTYNLDVRGDGGLFVGPGSIHKTGGIYTEVERWTTDLLRLAPVFDPSWLAIAQGGNRRQSPPDALRSEPRSPTETTARQEALQFHLLTVPGSVQGQGSGAEKYLFAICCHCLWAFDITPEEALPYFVEWGEKTSNKDDRGNHYPWTASELRHKLTDADNCPDKDGKPRGWRLPSIVWEKQKVKKVKIEELPPDELADGATTQPTASPVMGGDEIDSVADSENITFVIDDLLETSSVNMISGRSLSGKTYLMTYAIGAILEGGDFLGKRCQPSKVLYINCDMNRIKKLRRNIKRGMVSAHKAEAFRKRMFMVKSECLPETLTIEQLQKYVEAVHKQSGNTDPVVIFIETFRSAFLGQAEQGEENDAVVMKYIKPIKKWCLDTTNAVMIVHHNNKHADDYTGSSAFLQLLESKWNYKRAEDSPTGILTISTREDFFVHWEIGLNEDRKPFRLDVSTKAKADDKMIDVENVALSFNSSNGLTVTDAFEVYKTNGNKMAERSFRNYKDFAVEIGKLVCTQDAAGRQGAVYKYTTK